MLVWINMALVMICFIGRTTYCYFEFTKAFVTTVRSGYLHNNTSVPNITNSNKARCGLWSKSRKTNLAYVIATYQHAHFVQATIKLYTFVDRRVAQSVKEQAGCASMVHGFNSRSRREFQTIR